jgi:hypothetical protein
MWQQEVQKALRQLGPHIVRSVMARAAMGDTESQKALLPYIMPKAAKGTVPLSARVEIDIKDLESAKGSLLRIAAAMGEGQIGLDEGERLMDAVGKAIDRMTMADVNELAARLAELEKTKDEQVMAPRGAGAAPQSRANGSTPVWGNIQHHPSLKVVGGNDVED